MMNKPVNQIEAAIEEHFGKENIDEQEQYETEMEEQYNKGYQKGYAEGLKDGKLEGHLALEKLRSSFTNKGWHLFDYRYCLFQVPVYQHLLFLI